ncbi:MAG: YceD family protein [Candidatus Heteroscillospira sp.]|jgi:uncharacterized protein
MRLNLNEIIEIPGGSVPFRCELDAERLKGPSVLSFEGTPVAEGIVRNIAGALTLTGSIRADMLRVCDRCMGEYRQEKLLPVEVHLSVEVEDDENPDIYPIENDGWLELSDVLETCFILDMEAKSLCKDDCAGLCQTCGANLNLGSCNCRASIDPRLAVLGQLLDRED